MIYDGWHEKTWHPSFDSAPLLICGIKILRKDIKNYLDDEFTAVYLMWTRIKRFGLPQGKGYLEEPETVLEVVELFESELEARREKEREDRGRSNGRTAGTR